MNRRLRVCIVTATYPRHEEGSVPRLVADLADRPVPYRQIDVYVIAPHEGVSQGEISSEMCNRYSSM